jgi:hypothetical protein
MIDATARFHHAASNEGAVSVSGRTQPQPSQSFAAELSDKLAGTTESDTQSARQPTSEQTVTRRDPDSSATGTAKPSQLSALVINYPSSTGEAAVTTEASSQSLTFDQAYWASQPAAVQQLQTIQDPTQRAQVAQQLTQQGYSIDVPIMVWGWDPGTTTASREAMGYTWVPSAGQQPVEAAPGIAFQGESYNPNNPPAGSIAV